jgi:hypothetical protein
MRQVNPEILKDLKKGAILTGRLSEVHVKTLQSAPFVFFDGLLEVQVSYNLVVDGAAEVPGLGSTVKFTLDFGSKYEPDQYHEQRLNALIATVHTILWPGVEVIVVDQEGNNLKYVTDRRTK